MPNQFKDIPQPGDILATSQSDLEHNFLYIQGALGKDHQVVIGDTDTGTPFEGRHLQVSLKGQAASIAFPSDSVDSQIWSHSGNLFFQNGTAGQSFQFTTANSTANFGSIVNYQAAGGGFGSCTGGWTFLPGGLIMNYGSVTTVNPGGSINVKLACTFPGSNIASIVVTPNTTSSIGGGNHDWTVLSPTASQFTLKINGNYNAGDTFYFQVIGN